MRSPFKQRGRAAMLVLALGCVGGTGCAVFQSSNDAYVRSQWRENEAVRQRSIADLTPRAAAGDPAAMTGLALALMAQGQAAGRDPARVLDLLSRAAAQDHAPAQALLGEILADGAIVWDHYSTVPLPPALRDRERGFDLLRQAATRACRYPVDAHRLTNGTIMPSAALSLALAHAGRADEAALWRARGILQCGESTAGWTWAAKSPNGAPRQRIEALAFVLLAPGGKNVAEIEAAMPPDQVAAAHAQADDLRRRVAESERAYPAPLHQELP